MLAVRAEISLCNSRWQWRCRAAVVIAVAIALQIILQRESVAASWQMLIIAMFLFAAAAYQWRYRGADRVVDTLIIAAPTELWIGPSNQRDSLVDDQWPSLLAMREYLGLIWIHTTAGQWLIWPDQLVGEHARRMRIWLTQLSTPKVIA